MNLGVGVKVLSVQGSTITMESGHTIAAIVTKKMVGKEGLKIIWKQLMEIRQIMMDKNIAHTDIKPVNVAVKFMSQDLTKLKAFLIDNDDVKRYGQMRTVGTMGWNANQKSFGEICSASTDEMGWNTMRQFMSI